MQSKAEFEVSFDALDAVESVEAAELIASVEATGATASVVETHDQPKGMFDVPAIVALIAVSTASVAGLAATTAFMYKVFHKGVILDLTGDKPRVRKNNDLPKGTLLTLRKDGSTELHEGVEGKTVGELMKSAIESGRGGGDKEKQGGAGNSGERSSTV